MLQAAPSGAHFYYILFTFVINIVLFNIIMAIILDAYEVAKHKLEHELKPTGVAADARRTPCSCDSMSTTRTSRQK